MPIIPGHDDQEPLVWRVLALAALIRKVWRTIAKDTAAQLVSGGSVTMSDAGIVRLAWQTQLQNAVLTHVRNTYLSGAARIAEYISYEDDQAIGEDQVTDYLAQASNRLRHVGDDVWQDVRAQIKLGLDTGETVEEIAERVRNVAKLSLPRSRTIARTETHAAYEAGTLRQAIFVDPNATKTWLTTHDGTTRPSHAAADNQTVPVTQPFVVGGAKLMFPGDPLGGPHESINCRCSVAYEFADVTVYAELKPKPESELALTAAVGKWNPQSHPRGKDGKFIKKGDFTSFLGKSEFTQTDVLFAVNDLTSATWKNATSEQRQHLLDSIDDLAPGAQKIAKTAFEKKVGKSIYQAKAELLFEQSNKETPFSYLPESPAPVTLLDQNTDPLAVLSNLTKDEWANLATKLVEGDEIAGATNGDYAILESKEPLDIIAYDADGIPFAAASTPDQLGDSMKMSAGKWSFTLKALDALKSPSPALKKTPMPTPATPAPTQTKIPAGLKGNPGDPVKVTTGVIWGKHAPGTVVLENSTGDLRVVWNGKKYALEQRDDDDTWSVTAEYTKKDAYAEFKDSTNWLIPGEQKTALATEPVTDATIEQGGSLLDSGQIENMLNAATTGELNSAEAVLLVSELTPNQIQSLSDTQTKTIDYLLDSTSGTVLGGVKKAQSKWNLHKKKVPTPSPQEPTGFEMAPGKQPGTSLSDKDFVDVVQAAPFGFKDVIAVAKSGEYRVRWVAAEEAFHFEQRFPGEDEWTYYDQWDMGDGVATDPYMLNASVTNMLDQWNTEDWLKPGGPETSAPTAPLPGVVTDESVISNWAGLLAKTHESGSIVALSTDGKQRLIAGPQTGLYGLQQKFGDKWHAVGGWVDAGTKQADMESSSLTWVVPPSGTPKPPPDVPSTADVVNAPALTPGDPMTVSQAFDTAANFASPGELIAVGTLSSVPHAQYKLIASLTGGVTLKAHIGKMKDTPWVTLSTYDDEQAWLQDWPAANFTWQVPGAGDGDDDGGVAVPAVTTPGATSSPLPSTTPTPAVPPNATAPPFGGGSGSDISEIAAYHKLVFKNVFKQSNVGYWSKPEKIWDTLKEIQKQYPHPDSPGNSQFTPVQILKSLDSLTNTKKPSPYTDKIAKWASTAKGSAYVKGTGQVNPVSVTELLSPSKLADTLWADAYDIPSANDKPILVSSSGAKYKIQVINTTTGTNAPSMVGYYQAPSGKWQYFTAITDKDKLADFITKYDLQPTSHTNIPLAQTVVPNVSTPYVSPSTKKATAKTTTPTTSTKTTAPKPPSTQLVGDVAQVLGGEGDISHLTDEKKQAVYTAFKKQPSTYLDSPEKDIFIALKHISSDNGLTLLQGLKVIDDVGAKKFGVANAYLFEKKIKAWLQTPKGTAVALGQPVPKPPRPKFKTGVSTVGIPPLSQSDKLTYSTITTQQANAEWAKMTAQYGPWTTAEQSGLKSYTGGIYYSINGYLYGEYDSISSTNEKAMHNAQLGMRPSVSPMLLHRGVGFDGAANSTSHADLASKVGQTWRNDGFSSTSVGGKAAFGGNPVILEIEAPPGTPMAWLKPISQFSSENEMLLAAGTNYKILSVKKVGGQSYVRLRVVPDEEA